MKKPSPLLDKDLCDIIYFLKQDCIAQYEIGLEFDAADKCRTACSHPVRIRYERAQRGVTIMSNLLYNRTIKLQRSDLEDVIRLLQEDSADLYVAGLRYDPVGNCITPYSDPLRVKHASVMHCVYLLATIVVYLKSKKMSCYLNRE